MKLSSETFVVPDAGAYLVYAPLKGVLIRADKSSVAALAEMMDTGVPDPSSSLFNELRRCGVIDGNEDFIPAPPPVPTDYRPSQVTLLLTTVCNLGCSYCYADANQHVLEMPIDLGLAAIDFAAANAAAKKLPVLQVSFHGGGEPTTAWKAMQTFHDFAHKSAAARGMEARVSTITNGCISENKATWIAMNCSGGTLSWDGPPDVQDRQRPMVGGQPSSDAVRRTARIFDEHGFNYGIQSTVTAETVERLPELVRYFAENAKTRKVKFEPATAAGRYAGGNENVPSLDRFAASFNDAWDVAKELGIELMFSAATRIFGKPSCYFCGAHSEPFVVTPDGHVTACYEVSEQDKPFEDIFFIGDYNQANGRFEVDHQKLVTLSQRSVNNLDACSKCFCKYSCAGDCASRNMRDSGEIAPHLFLQGQRCDAIRTITKHQLSRFVDAQEAAHANKSDTSDGTLANEKAYAHGCR